MKGVKYVAPVFDNSGYGEASRNYILSLYNAGVPITVEARSFESNPAPVGTQEERDVLNSLVDRDIEFDVVIVHLTPDLAPAYLDKYPGKYMISYTVWETSKLHPLWAECCNLMDEVWLPCDWNIEAFKSSGVTVPLIKIPHGIDPKTFDSCHGTDLFSNATGSTFNFYSIMQWNARKNPEGLLRAYYNAFRNEEDVRLILKTYIGRGLPPSEEARRLKEAVQRIKVDMQLPSYPKVVLISDVLSTEQMKGLHLFGDAYVSIPHGEGWCLPMMEAGLAGNPVIGTGVGGNMEYMDEINSYPVPYIWDYVYGMATFNPWYLGEQQWARPSVPETSRLMSHVFNYRERSKAKGLLLQKKIKEEFSWDSVASKMIRRLSEL